MIGEGHLDNSEGNWDVDEEDGTEGFLEADEDAFWVFDDENYTTHGSSGDSSDEAWRPPERQRQDDYGIPQAQGGDNGDRWSALTQSHLLPGRVGLLSAGYFLEVWRAEPPFQLSP